MTPNQDSQPVSREGSTYRYWAFVSYSSTDTALAKRFHRALETYHIPRDLVGRPGRDGEPVPRALFPIFRDRDELPLSADIGESVHDALRASRYLIVLCSPEAAQSRWVNEEIRYFKSLGRQDHILALIVRGEPNVSDHPDGALHECFPPALRHRVGPKGGLTTERCEPVGGDLRRGGDGWTACLLKAVAGITGLGYSAFAKREVKRRRRRQVLYLCGLVGLVAGLFCWWDYTRVKVAWYAHLTEQWGVPEGTISLNKEQVRHRNFTYKVESSRRKIRRVLRVNSVGELRDDAEDFGASIREAGYGEDGRIQQLSLRDHNGRLVARKKFSPVFRESGQPVMYVEFKTEHQDAPLALPGLAASFDLARFRGEEAARSEISVHRVIYGVDGLPGRVAYLNVSRQPRATAEGVFGQAWRYDANCLPIETTHLGFNGQPAPARQGIMTRRMLRDAMGNEIEKSFLGKDGRLVMSRDGYARVISKYDKRGNRVEQALVGTDGQPVLIKEGFARVTIKYDERGNMIEAACFGTDGLPVLNKNGVARATSKYDERGNMIEAACFGTDGQPVLNKYGVAGVNSTFDERGNRIEEAYYGTDGQPVLGKDGAARVTSKFDERGNPIEEAYFGTNGQPVLNTNGFARVIFKFDERGNPIEEAYFGADGKPVLHKDGFATMARKYDELLRTFFSS